MRQMVWGATSGTTLLGRVLLGAAAIAIWTSPGVGQVAQGEAVEIPLTVEEGRLVITAQGPDGSEHSFVLGLGMNMLTESGARRLGGTASSLTLGGVTVNLEEAVTVPDAHLTLAGVTPAGVIGGGALNRFDILIDVESGRLLLKPAGRAVRWPRVSLSSPVSVDVFHDVLIRVDVEVGGQVVKGLLDLVEPRVAVNAPLSSTVDANTGTFTSFRMGYSGWTDLPAEVSDSPVFGRWAPVDQGFVIIGASLTYDCVLAVSWAHAELRTCLQ